MVIDMNEAQVRTLEQVREVLAGTQSLEMRMRSPMAKENNDVNYEHSKSIRLDGSRSRRSSAE